MSGVLDSELSVREPLDLAHHQGAEVVEVAQEDLGAGVRAGQSAPGTARSLEAGYELTGVPDQDRQWDGVLTGKRHGHLAELAFVWAAGCQVPVLMEACNCR